MKSYNLVIVDDHTLFRKGLKALIDVVSNITVVGEASNGKEFLKIISNKMPDLVLMDINMPVMNGFEATKSAVEMYPDIKIVALSMHGDEQYYYKMVEAGVKGFLLKDADSDELENALQEVLDGKNYFSQELLKNIIFKNNEGSEERDDDNSIKISEREKEVLKLICAGLSTHEIASKLYISKRTVDRHRENLLLKTETHNSVSLVMHAIKNKLIDV